MIYLDKLARLTAIGRRQCCLDLSESIHIERITTFNYFQTSCFPFGNHGTLTKDWDGHCDDVVGDYCEMMVIRIQEVCMMVTMLRMRITD